MKKLILLIIIALLAIAGFIILNIGNSYFSLNPKLSDSGIEGKITYGPTSPVCRINEPCEKPYFGEVLIKSRDSLTLIMVFNTTENGDFKISLKPSTYLIETKQKFIITCNQYVIVKNNDYTNVSINCDTGIR